jgi:hypothetical protein
LKLDGDEAPRPEIDLSDFELLHRPARDARLDYDLLDGAVANGIES